MEKVAVTVTVVADALSETLDGFTVRLTAGAGSSSVMVALAPFTVRSVDVPSTLMVSLPSTSVSCFGVRVNVPVPLVSPAVMVTSRSATSA